jgi:predicted dehydrogenase
MAVVRVMEETARGEAVGFVEKNPKRREELARQYPDAVIGDETELAAVLEKTRPDVFVDAGPDHLHGPNSVTALEHDCHVLIEKPMATTLADAKAILAAERASGKIVTVDYTMRYSHPWGTVMQAAKAGRVGKIFYLGGFYVHDMWDYYNAGGSEYTPWRSDPDNPQNILFGGGVHPLDLMLCVMDGIPVTDVYCAGNQLAESGMPMEDLFVVTMTFANGVVGKLLVSSGCSGWDFGQMLEVYGTDGTLYEGTLYRRWKDPEPLPEPEKVGVGHGWNLTVPDFLDAVDGTKDNWMNSTFGARNVSICEAAMTSLRSGTAQKVEWFD